MSDLRDLEYSFCSQINNCGELSADIISQNGSVDIICVTALKTGKSVSLNFDFLCREIKFWDIDDKAFSYPMDTDGQEKLFNELKRYLNNMFYFQPLYNGRITSSFMKVIFQPSIQIILDNFNEILPYIDEGFESVKVFNALGNYNYIIDSNGTVKEV
ncbi:MAG: hypothetical protein NC131_05320 [Roseburia sp.]|nr:hypothetical protein [Roseburia sp.]